MGDEILDIGKATFVRRPRGPGQRPKPRDVPTTWQLLRGMRFSRLEVGLGLAIFALLLVLGLTVLGPVVVSFLGPLLVVGALSVMWAFEASAYRAWGEMVAQLTAEADRLRPPDLYLGTLAVLQAKVEEALWKIDGDEAWAGVRALMDEWRKLDKEGQALLAQEEKVAGRFREAQAMSRKWESLFCSTSCRQALREAFIDQSNVRGSELLTVHQAMRQWVKKAHAFMLKAGVADVPG